jgi:DNA-3-methyladenine glycosylase
MLLGWRLTHATAEGTVAVVLTEVEAYGGVGDPASHAYRGETQRNTVMFGPAGHLYCYFSYGMHWCANVVCGEDGVAMAVLLRAGRLVTGADLARERRGPTVRDRDLARGPARLTRALGIEGRHNGVDLLGGGPLTLSPSAAQPAYECGPRVGIRLAADQPWRFWITGDETVSSYRRSPRATPVTDDPAGAAAGH